MLKREQMLPSLLICLLLSVSCTDSDLGKVSKGLLATAKGLETLQATVIEANKTMLPQPDGTSVQMLSDDETRKVLEACIRINTLGRQAVSITREISKLDPASRTQLRVALGPMVQALNAEMIEDIANVKNPGMRLTITTALTTAKTLLVSALTVIGGQ